MLLSRNHTSVVNRDVSLEYDAPPLEGKQRDQSSPSKHFSQTETTEDDSEAKPRASRDTSPVRQPLYKFSPDLEFPTARYEIGLHIPDSLVSDIIPYLPSGNFYDSAILLLYQLHDTYTLTDFINAYVQVLNFGDCWYSLVLLMVYVLTHPDETKNYPVTYTLSELPGACLQLQQALSVLESLEAACPPHFVHNCSSLRDRRIEGYTSGHPLLLLQGYLSPKPTHAPNRWAIPDAAKKLMAESIDFLTPVDCYPDIGYDAHINEDDEYTDWLFHRSLDYRHPAEVIPGPPSLTASTSSSTTGSSDSPPHPSSLTLPSVENVSKGKAKEAPAYARDVPVVRPLSLSAASLEPGIAALQLGDLS